MFLYYARYVLHVTIAHLKGSASEDFLQFIVFKETVFDQIYKYFSDVGFHILTV